VRTDAALPTRPRLGRATDTSVDTVPSRTPHHTQQDAHMHIRNSGLTRRETFTQCAQSRIGGRDNRARASRSSSAAARGNAHRSPYI
jgi:hypothetical protein